MKVVLTNDALADLDEIANWIAQDSLERAEKFVGQLRSKCATLTRDSRRYPVARRVASEDVRKLAYRRYLIFYRIRAAEVDVLRIVHGARDWAVLFREPE